MRDHFQERAAKCEKELVVLAENFVSPSAFALEFSSKAFDLTFGQFDDHRVIGFFRGIDGFGRECAITEVP